MSQFIMGYIRQLTTRKTEPFVGKPATTKDGFGWAGAHRRYGIHTGRVPNEQQKQLNIVVQSVATDIVTRLITADVILSQQAERVEEIVGDMLRRAFEGATLAAEGWLAARDTSHAFHQELKLRSVHCAECQTDTSVDWLS